MCEGMASAVASAVAVALLCNIDTNTNKNSTNVIEGYMVLWGVSGNITLFASAAITLRRRLSRVCARFPSRILSVKSTRLPLFLSRRINTLEQPERVKKRALSALCTWRYSLVSHLSLLHHPVRLAIASSPKLLAFPFGFPLLYPSIHIRLCSPSHFLRSSQIFAIALSHYALYGYCDCHLPLLSTLVCSPFSLPLRD